MGFYFSYNKESGKFEGISEKEIVDQDIVLFLDMTTRKAVLYFKDTIGLAINTPTQEETQKSFEYLEILDEKYVLDVEKIDDLNSILQSQTEHATQISKTSKNEITLGKLDEPADEQYEEILTVHNYHKDAEHIEIKSTPVTVCNCECPKHPKSTKSSIYVMAVIYGTHIDKFKSASVITNKNKVGYGSYNSLGLDFAHRIIHFDDIIVKLEISLIHEEITFDHLIHRFLKGSNVGMVYYNPRKPESIDSAIETCNDMAYTSKDCKIAIIKCGKGEFEIHKDVLPTNNIIGYYEIDDESDPFQQKIIFYLVSQFLSDLS